MTGPDPAPSKPTRSTTTKPKSTPRTASPKVPADEGTAADALPAVPETATQAVPAVAAEIAPPVVAAPAAAEIAAPALAPETAPAVAAEAASQVAAEPIVAAPAVAAADPAVAAADPAPAPAATQPTSAPSRLTTPDVAGAVDKAMDRLRTHLTLGEIVAGLGAVIILGVAFGLFGVFFGHGGTWPNDLVVLLSLGLLGALVLQNAHIHDFGPGYRLIVATLCLALGVIAALQVLRELRFLINGVTFDIGGLTWWAGAVIAVIGGLMVWHEDR